MSGFSTAQIYWTRWAQSSRSSASGSPSGTLDIRTRIFLHLHLHPHRNRNDNRAPVDRRTMTAEHDRKTKGGRERMRTAAVNRKNNLTALVVRGKSRKPSGLSRSRNVVSALWLNARTALYTTESPTSPLKRGKIRSNASGSRSGRGRNVSARKKKEWNGMSSWPKKHARKRPQ